MENRVGNYKSNNANKNSADDTVLFIISALQELVVNPGADSDAKK